MESFESIENSINDLLGSDDDFAVSLITDLKESNCDSYSVNNDVKKQEAKKLVTSLTDLDRSVAVKLKIVPKAYEKCCFDSGRIKANILEQDTNTKGIYKIKNLQSYLDTCYGVLSALRASVVPTKSFIIGAPNGFGKTSFVNECLMTMVKNNMVAVPFVSLMELAEIRTAEERRLLSPYTVRHSNATQDDNGYYYTDVKEPDIVKLPEEITGYYSWSEYMNTPCLFCQLSDVASRNIESRVLYQILRIRGSKGLPTIVMISTSLEPYKRDQALREQVWEEILNYSGTEFRYDTLQHISTFRVRSNKLIED